jgi:hypothetical protein
LSGDTVIKLRNLFLFICIYPAGLSAMEIEDFVAQYVLQHGDMQIGKRTLELSSSENGNRTLRSTARTTGIAAWFLKDNIDEYSLWKSGNGGVIPLLYEYDHKGGRKDRHVKIKFDWQNKQAINIIQDDPWKMDIPLGTQDKLVYMISLMRDLSAGHKQIVYPIADGGRLKEYDFRIIKEETLDTAMGKIETVKLRRIRQKKKRETYIWCARNYSYLPVRIQQIKKGDTAYDMIIESISGLGKAPGH